MLRRAWRNGAWAALGCAYAFAGLPAQALVVELKDAASDRIERQRAASIGQLPLPETPEIGRLAQRLAERGFEAGAPALIRVFKASSELELWLLKGQAFELFATYPICQWSGTLGPKLFEGDKQTPEGIYTVARDQLFHVGRWPRSLNLGFPNALDRAHGHTGSHILVHGGCSSVGCFAMTNPVMQEIYELTRGAIAGGQPSIQVHVFPFRMTEGNLARHADSQWQGFWRNLKDAYDSFERTRLPPRVGVCEGRYRIDDAGPQEVAGEDPLALCGVSRAASLLSTATLPSPAAIQPRPAVSPRLARLLSRLQSANLAGTRRVIALPGQLSPSSSPLPANHAQPSPNPAEPSARNAWQLTNVPIMATLATGNRNSRVRGGPIQPAVRRSALKGPALGATGKTAAACDTTRPSCVKWLALDASRRLAAAEALIAQQGRKVRVAARR